MYFKIGWNRLSPRCPSKEPKNFRISLYVRLNTSSYLMMIILFKMPIFLIMIIYCNRIKIIFRNRDKLYQLLISKERRNIKNLSPLFTVISLGLKTAENWFVKVISISHFCKWLKGWAMFSFFSFLMNSKLANMILFLTYYVFSWSIKVQSWK